LFETSPNGLVRSLVKSLAGSPTTEFMKTRAVTSAALTPAGRWPIFGLDRCAGEEAFQLFAASVIEIEQATRSDLSI
jgi:hypothetical protein